MTKNKEVFICCPKRTAIGSFQGALASVGAPDLAASVIKNILENIKVPGNDINEVILGCVLTAGIGQAPARQALIKSGLPNSVQAMTVNKVCSSGLKAVLLAVQNIKLGLSEAVLAGGMENMSLAPYLLPSLRQGARLGHVQSLDSIVKDGLWDVYNDYHMGSAAELCAKKYSLSREAQDNFAIESYKRSQKAINDNIFSEEIVTVKIKEGKTEIEFKTDEEPGKAKLDKIPQLKPVFEKEGTVTAANASSINDGAAVMLVCSEDFLKKHNLVPVAKFVEQGWHSQEPEWFTTAPIGAVEMLLKRASKKLSDIDLFEINEAFSAVALACQKGLDIPSEKLNIYGGAVSLGHPIGASGARILTTLIYALGRNKKKLGVAGICNGGGEATAILVERL